jgi:hypothetical protein
MAYADSAIDYRWTIHSISTAQRRMTVTYDPADSADTSRPTVFQNFSIPYDDFTESDLTAIATSSAASKRVAEEWDRVVESETVNASFPEDSYVGFGGTSRYKVAVYDSAPNYNSFTHRLEETVTVGSDTITYGWVSTPLDSAEKLERYTARGVDRRRLWTRLLSEGHRDSFVQILKLNDSAEDWSIQGLNFLSSSVIDWGDSVTSIAKDLFGENDSDFAAATLGEF